MWLPFAFKVSVAEQSKNFLRRKIRYFKLLELTVRHQIRRSQSACNIQNTKNLKKPLIMASPIYSHTVKTYSGCHTLARMFAPPTPNENFSWTTWDFRLGKDGCHTSPSPHTPKRTTWPPVLDRTRCEAFCDVSFYVLIVLLYKRRYENHVISCIIYVTFTLLPRITFRKR